MYAGPPLAIECKFLRFQFFVQCNLSCDWTNSPEFSDVSLGWQILLIVGEIIVFHYRQRIGLSLRTSLSLLKAWLDVMRFQTPCYLTGQNDRLYFQSCKLRIFFRLFAVCSLIKWSGLLAAGFAIHSALIVIFHIFQQVITDMVSFLFCRHILGVTKTVPRV